MTDEATVPTQRAERPPNRGWFQKGNAARATGPNGSGLFSERDLANLKAEVAEYLAGAIADDGGESEVPTRRRSLLEYRARVHRRITQLDAALEVRGLFDARGKLRVAWLQQLQGLIATARGIDSLLGLSRRQKPVPSLSEYLNSKSAAEISAS